MLVCEVVVPPPPGATPPELGVVVLVGGATLVAEGGLEDGLTDVGGVVAILEVLVVVVEDCEVLVGGLAAAEVGTVSGATPLVSAVVPPPALLPPQPAIAAAASAPVMPAPSHREKRDVIALTNPVAPTAARSAGSR